LKQFKKFDLFCKNEHLKLFSFTVDVLLTRESREEQPDIATGWLAG
jgi:hypothetical protein